MSVRRMMGENNHAGDLAPLTSPYGDALRAGLGQIVNDPAPIGSRFRDAFYGTVGAVATRAANTRAIGQQTTGYFGDLPQSQQPLVDAPEPWDRDDAY